MPIVARLGVVLTLSLFAADAGVRAQARSIDDFFREFAAEWVRGNPNQAVATRYLAGPEQERLERELTPATSAWQRHRVQLASRGLAALRRFDRVSLPAAQQVAAELLDWQLDTIAAGEPYLDYVFPLEQFGGTNISLVTTLTVSHPVRSARDGENYLARLAQVGARMAEAAAEARRLDGAGILPPRFILRATIAQMQQFIAPPPAEHGFVATLNERLAGLPDVPAARRESLVAEAARLVETGVYPAWRTAIALLTAQAERATDEAGLWRLPRGREAYAYHLRRHTTTTLTADEIHEIGLREVERIEQEMGVVLHRLGRTNGALNDRIEQLGKDLSYPLDEQGRGALMADVEAVMRDAEQRVAPFIERPPRATVIAQAYPRFREATAAASYNAPPLDGSRPGIFQIPLRPARMSKFGLRTLVYHETVPGHHLQVALDLENTAQPLFRRVRLFGGITALTEGWALYAERLAAESGWYENDPEGLLGYLDAQLFRARRLVVDTGLHAKRWTREQAIAYGIEASEVDRYVVNPGQACAYMIGQLEIVELRERARRALGDRFSLTGFHNAVLGAGTLPLDMLERQVDAYIRAAR
ncbi:MAG: hypothetical protein A3I61_12470 [Acidobacteria bacterium RIFCSPLOWO2_02_FULL_68_18]|nr:MAG: hypothetical protein A3I61_12470 [Acidobacteria bacterium RIFCSPLOWO2_02_FULL_68_18]OFW49337.1 MAG: hypothetical protein A3G77_03715 [Acidobacteria bacterium RIFCSPLOWO2_12_FULL_68_19]